MSVLVKTALKKTIGVGITNKSNLSASIYIEVSSLLSNCLKMPMFALIGIIIQGLTVRVDEN